MSTYPPPPPPPPPSQPSPVGPPDYNQRPQPGFNPSAWKEQGRVQERLVREQVRLQREQLRARNRAARRYSVVGPLFLLLLGVVFLLLETGRLSWTTTILWYSRWWPLLLIGAGLLMLVEWLTNGRRGALLGGGVVALLIFLAFVGWSAGVIRNHSRWTGNGNNFGWAPFLGETHTEDGTPLSSAMDPAGTLLVHNPFGAVSVTGSSDDGEVHVSAHKEMRSTSDSHLDDDRRALQPYFSGSPASLQLNVGQADDSHVDLQVTVPRGVTLSVEAGHGAVNIGEMHAPVTVSAHDGEVTVSGIAGPVTAHLNTSDDTFSARSITGAVLVDGRSGDVNLSDITGAVSLQGRFSGTTHIERVNGPVGFETYRTQLHVARVDGQLDISSGDSDAPLQGEGILGPVTLRTRDRVITLDRVQGDLDVVNSNGALNVTTAGPLGTVALQNRDASVVLALPADAGFTVNAQTRDGHLTNDFGLTASGNDEGSALSGSVGHGGPSVSIHTSDGDISLHKSSEQALPATLVALPVLSAAPAAPNPTRSVSAGAQAGPRSRHTSPTTPR